MKPTQLEGRPPYAVFEYRSKEDRTASLAAGHPVYVEEAWIIVTPQGSKDRHERLADEWLEQKKRDVEEGRFPEEWYQAYKRHYELWKQNEAIPEDGTALKNWPTASKAQIQTLLALNIRTVEDLAAANEESISRMGMGGRTLKQRAVEWLSSAENQGKTANRMTAVEQENAELREVVKKQGEQIARLLQAMPPIPAGAVPAAQSPGLGITPSDFLS